MPHVEYCHFRNMSPEHLIIGLSLGSVDPGVD